MTSGEKKRFFRIMKEAGIYSDYLREVRKNHNMRSTMVKKHGGDIKSFFEGESYGVAIDYAFIWDDSRLGYGFWSTVSGCFPGRYCSYSDIEKYTQKIKGLLRWTSKSLKY